MIQANELRIGNLVQTDYEEIVEVININSEGFGFIDMRKQGYCAIGRIELKLVDGIPLTEECLLRFGAETYEFDNGEANQYRIGNRLFVIRNGQIVDYASSVVLKYVHQLQNLYFALKQTELTLKDNI